MIVALVMAGLFLLTGVFGLRAVRDWHHAYRHHEHRDGYVILAVLESLSAAGLIWVLCWLLQKL